MSEFEFVLVSFAIIVGFGISEILAGWGQQIRARDRLRPFLLQVTSSAFILFFSLLYLWGLWLLRDVEWSFPLFLLVAGPALVVALAAHAVRVDTSADAAPIREQYFQNSGPVFSLLAMFPVFVMAMSFTTSMRGTVPNPPSLVPVTIARVAVLALMLSLAWSKNEKYHWGALGLLWLAAVALMARLMFSLAESAA